MKKFFEYALEHNEIVPFFKGEGDYFSPNEMARGHLYIINWSSMCNYLQHQTNPFDVLVNVFKIYLNSLDDKVLDSWGLFQNLKCYYLLRFRHDYFFNDHDDLIAELDKYEKIKIGRLFRLLRDNFDKVPGAKEMSSFETLVNFLPKNGCEYDFFSF